MKKLCKLFYKNDTLGKWILYDVETKKVLEVKKYDKEGTETYVNLLEQEMFQRGVLELEHSIKIWEIELQLAEIPVIPQIPNQLPEPYLHPIPWFNPILQPPQQQRLLTTDRTWPIGIIGSSDVTINGSTSAGLNGMTLIVTNAMSQNQIMATLNGKILL